MTDSALSSLNTCLKKVTELREQGHVIYPEQPNILRAIETLAPDDVKCVIIGQDPYHGPRQATGLSFSVPSDVKMPPSLRNIFAEIRNEYGYEMPASGDLSPWAERGVMLLNASLTVEQGLPNSHANLGWKDVTADIVRITLTNDNPCCYLLWGRYAQNMVRDVAATCRDSIDASKKRFVLTSHPSPYSADKAGRDFKAFLGSDCFKICNEFLVSQNESPIEWNLS